MIVYHDKNCVEAKLQPELVKVLNNPEIDLGDTSKAIYKYWNVDGVIVKRIIDGRNIFGEKPMFRNYTQMAITSQRGNTRIINE